MRFAGTGFTVIGLIGAMMCGMIGCEAPPRKLPPIILPPAQAGEAKPQSNSESPAALIDQPSFIDPHTAESAQAQTASMPPIADLRIQQEILLHAALYRTAYENRVGNAGHFVLEPMQEDRPPDLGVDPADFRLHVLAELADLGSPVAWTPSTWQTQTIDFFPGTNEKATRLIIKVFNRDEDQATVIGEIGDRTAGASSSRQAITATWDGVRWNIERDRIRVVW